MCFPLSWQLDTMLTMQLGMIPAGLPDVGTQTAVAMKMVQLTVEMFWRLLGRLVGWLVGGVFLNQKSVDVGHDILPRRGVVAYLCIYIHIRIYIYVYIYIYSECPRK